MSDNNLFAKSFYPLIGVSKGAIISWRSTVNHKVPPRWARILFTYVQRELNGNAKRAILCRCACGGKTFKSILTGQWNLFLPGHSPAAKQSSWRFGKKDPIVNLPLPCCVRCHGPLTEGEIQKKGVKSFAKKVQLCKNCGFIHYLAEPVSA